MRIITLILLFGSLLFGSNYNYVLLKAQATIFPKIMLLDKKLDEKLINGKIVYTVVYDESDYNTALDVSELIKDNHNGQLGKYDYRVNLVKSSDLSVDTEATAIYSLNSDKDITKVANIAKEKGIVAFFI